MVCRGLRRWQVAPNEVDQAEASRAAGKPRHSHSGKRQIQQMYSVMLCSCLLELGLTQRRKKADYAESWQQ